MTAEEYITLVRRALDDPGCRDLSRQQYLDALQEIAADVESRIDCVQSELDADEEDS